jgi:hypothetical protein
MSQSFPFVMHRDGIGITVKKAPQVLSSLSDAYSGRADDIAHRFSSILKVQFGAGKIEAVLLKCQPKSLTKTPGPAQERMPGSVWRSQCH